MVQHFLDKLLQNAAVDRVRGFHIMNRSTLKHSPVVHVIMYMNYKMLHFFQENK
jgi:hypothetical protein